MLRRILNAAAVLLEDGIERWANLNRGTVRVDRATIDRAAELALENARLRDEVARLHAALFVSDDPGQDVDADWLAKWCDSIESIKPEDPF
jgi:hypothetical protein